MYDVYNPSIYNAFIKELRQKHNLTIRDFSKKIHYSIGLLSEIENDPDLLNNGKLSVLLTYYGYDIDYLYYFDRNLTTHFNAFTHALLYMEDDALEQQFTSLLSFFSQYEDTILYLCCDVCHFLYHVYKFNTLSAQQNLSFLNNMEHFSNAVLPLVKIYLGRYYIKKKQYNLALNYLNTNTYSDGIDDNIRGLSQLTLSTYYLRNNDIFTSIAYCDSAISSFTKTQNYRRLVNINIIKANQYLKIKDFKSSLSLNELTLKIINDKNYSMEKRSVLNNIAYIYMIQNKYDKAIFCFENMPKEHMKDKHFYSYMICLTELEKYELAESICHEWISKTNNGYTRQGFMIFSHYFIHKDLLKLNRQLIKLLNNYINEIDQFEIELLYNIIAYHYKKLNKYKSAMEYLEKLKELNY